MLDNIFQENKKHFSSSDHRIMDCLLRNKNELQYITTEELIVKSGISASTVSRFWKKIGFKDIKEFKRYLRDNICSTPASKISVTLRQWNEKDFNIHDFMSRYYYHIEKTLGEVMPETLKEAAECIISAPKIYIFAPDGSSGLAEILIYRLNRFGIEFLLLKGGSALYESLVNFSANDLVIMFSYSRLLSEVKILLKHSKIAGYHTILFTDLMTSDYLELADIILYSYRGEPNEYHSMMSPLALLDLLILKIAQLKENPLEKMKYLQELRETYGSIIKR
ncbi:MurR/RpiR family transcriptional regulator [Desulfosporosinus sp. FKA]|uniref:MurR/RpiR family transcriptional regulator n=1 Tax=Desulfosporosinus sp. FKA TaxID=1969834 RepID=UPI000B49B76A|nr:MurR/RpiR family transcriptional regulator [Desulfosporosinus sp. FKA]